MPNNPALLTTLYPGPPVYEFFSDWQTGFNLSWELDFWGRFRRNIESANADLDASVEDYDAALVTLLADVAANYTRYRVAQQRIDIARANVQIQEDVLELAEEKFRVGTSTKLDVEQAKTVLEQTRSLIPAFEIELGQANDMLCTLLGRRRAIWRASWGRVPGRTIDAMPKTPDWVAAGIPADLLRQRPDVRSAERQIAAQSAQIGVAEAELYPSFYINGTIGYESQDLSPAARIAELHGQRRAELSLEHPQLRADPQQRPTATGADAGADRDVSEHGAHRRPRNANVTARLSQDPRTSRRSDAGALRRPPRRASSASSNTARAPCPSTRCSTWKRRRCSSRINWRWCKETLRSA